MTPRAIPGRNEFGLPDDPGRAARRQTLTVKCPACRVDVGRMCTLEAGGKSRPRTTAHPSRELVAGVRPPLDEQDRQILVRRNLGGSA